MRILKALAAVLAGTLLLALPAVAMPRDPQDPDCETAGDTTDQAGEENSGDTLQEPGGTAGESGDTTDDQASLEECAPEDQSQENKSQLQDELGGLLGGLLGGS